MTTTETPETPSTTPPDTDSAEEEEVNEEETEESAEEDAETAEEPAAEAESEAPAPDQDVETRDTLKVSLMTSPRGILIGVIRQDGKHDPFYVRFPERDVTDYTEIGGAVAEALLMADNHWTSQPRNPKYVAPKGTPRETKKQEEKKDQRKAAGGRASQAARQAPKEPEPEPEPQPQMSLF